MRTSERSALRLQWTELSNLSQRDDRVQATLTCKDNAGKIVSEEIVEVPGLIGCDGARRTTRKLCQIAYLSDAYQALEQLGDVLTVQGKLRQAADVYRQFLQEATNDDGRLQPVACFALLGSGVSSALRT
ncbi:hypothetical protein KFU94_48260 [Chloroflexi bacterium TSY]|nr:hypothetical protein [Chloroflexi bacterium TSY]